MWDVFILVSNSCLGGNASLNDKNDPYKLDIDVFILVSNSSLGGNAYLNDENDPYKHVRQSIDS